MEGGTIGLYSYAPIVGLYLDDLKYPRASVITLSTSLPAAIAELPALTGHV